jgi:hypothetical protein
MAAFTPTTTRLRPDAQTVRNNLGYLLIVLGGIAHHIHGCSLMEVFISKIIWQFSICALLVLTARLAMSGVFRSYFGFFLFTLTLIGWNAILLTIDQRSHSYAYLWASMQTHVAAMEALVAAETIRKLVPHLKHFGRFGFLCFSVLVGITTAFGIGALMYLRVTDPQNYGFIRIVYWSKLIVDFATLMVCIVAISVARGIEQPLAKRHARLFSIYLSVSGCGVGIMLAAHDSYSWSLISGILTDGGVCGLALFWMTLLTKRHVRLSSGPSDDGPHDEGSAMLAALTRRVRARRIA